MTCKPKTVPKLIQPPKKNIDCFNCGCSVPEGYCHCGASNWWSFDVFDGWHTTGSIPDVVIRNG